MIVGLENLLPVTEFKEFEAAIHRYPDRCIRMRADRNGETVPFPVENVPWFDGGFWVPDPAMRPGGFLSYAAADYYIQDAASLLPIRLARIESDDWVCDVCAAPGGKATAVAELLGGNGALVANEAIRSRVDVLRYALARTGRANYATCNLDPDALQLRCNALFNKVLVDAPCSGQTLLGKDKQSEAAFSERQIAHCAARARRILKSAAALLRPGGLLVFSTCTFSIEENEAQIEWLQREYPGAWEVVDEPSLHAWKSPITAGCYRLWPHRDRCSGGFAAALKLVAELPSAHGSRPVRDHAAASSRKGARDNEAQMAEFLQSLGEWPKAWQWSDGSAFLLEEGIDRFRVANGDAFSPSPVAIQVGKHFEPMQALAMLNHSLFQPNHVLNLDDQQARAYMAGEALVQGQAIEGCSNQSDANSGTPWRVARWEKKPLGWLKRSASRYNNHLPPWARLQIHA